MQCCRTWNLTFLFLMGVSSLALVGADLPAWYLTVPGDEGLVTGRGMARVEKGDEANALAQAKRDAMRDLANTLLCRVTTAVIDHQQENNAGNVSGHFSSRTVVESALELMNTRLLNETVQDHMAYVMVGADRDRMAYAYRERTEQAFHKASDAFAQARLLENDKHARGALAAYETTLQALQEARNCLQVYMALNRTGDRPPVKPESLPEDAIVQQRLMMLSGQTPRNLKEIADTIAQKMTASLKPNAPRKMLCVLPIEYEQTGVVSAFGYQLTTALSAALAKHPAIGLTDVPGRGAVTVRGRMLREDTSVLLIFDAGQFSTQHYLSPATCQAVGKEKLEPADLQRLLEDKLALHQSMQPPAGLRLELQTDRMSDGPVIYRFGDQPKLAIRADRPCFVRLIYLTADGERLLLLDKYPIGENQVNRWVRLPLELEICEPAGAEQLLLQAASASDDIRLPALRVENVDVGGGYFMPFIREDLGNAMQRTRGIMKRKPRHFVEITSQWTVFPE